MSTLYTIGHSKLSIEEFIGLLKKYHINCVVDVRSTPFSKFAPQYNKDDLKISLEKSDIYYLGMSNEFGARRSDKELFAKDGYLDFEKVTKDKEFVKGVARIKNGIKKGYNIAFMCTEKYAIDCHRNILVAKYFHSIGFSINNIDHSGGVTTQEELEILLLDKYFPKRNEISMFANDNLSDKELVEKAFRKRNIEIGYRINNN